MTNRKKLIEVALPLDAINTASAREKSIRHGHPSTLHLWWARRPLAAARAVIFAQMVDDPSSRPELFPTEEAQEKERQRLFDIIEELVKWENTTNETVLQAARDEIWECWRRGCADNADHPRAAELFDPERLPPFHDPFAGGGSLPLEAQRLGLEAHASDLNPVAVLINKAMIEIPPKFAGRPPVNSEARADQALLGQTWAGAGGLAEDVRYYGRWLREEAERRIGYLYPKLAVTEELVRARPDLKRYAGRKLAVVAWLWARTVKSPNPACSEVEVPLISTFMLSTKRGKEAYVEPVIDGGEFHFTVKAGAPSDATAAKSGTKLSRGAFQCLMSGTPIKYAYIDDEANAGRMGERLMAIVVQGDRARLYLPPMVADVAVAQSAKPSWKPDTPSRGTWASNAQGRRYGFRTFGDYFTPRQLVALNTFSDLVTEARDRIRQDAVAAGFPNDGHPLHTGGTAATAYADAVGVYLAFAISKLADRGSSICTWFTERDSTRNTFARQSIPMTWDYAELNTLLDGTGSFMGAVEWTAESTECLASVGGCACGWAHFADAGKQVLSVDKIISTDPPYYDNIGYADLSDFFFVWLRRSLRSTFPDLFSTMAVPKAEELVATPYRHGTKAKAEAFFMDGMTRAMERLVQQAHIGFPTTIYYAFKQSESRNDRGVSSTGWETFLEAVISAGFGITGTWPMRTELANRMIGMGSNALASSVVLVCRKRSADAPIATRRDFIAALKAELPPALVHLQRGNIAPVDLAQAAIGPGMAVFTSYAKVLDASGNRVSVGDALALINQTLDETLAEQEGDFDAGSRWALAWFEQYGFDSGDYGIAETLSTAKNTSVAGMVEAGILHSRGGKVRLLRPEELPADWDPARDDRLITWEIVHHLIRVLEQSGEGSAAQLVRKLGGWAEIARELCYRLYTVCERKKRASDALAYNGLVQSWPEISRLARMEALPEQAELFAGGGTEGTR